MLHACFYVTTGGKIINSKFSVTAMLSYYQIVNICVWVLASAFGVPAMVMGNVEEEQEHNSK